MWETDSTLSDFSSSMRLATENGNRLNRMKSRRERILSRRGAFQFLPVLCSNDLVFGSWWFVVGSIIATIIPIVPLVDLFYPFWTKSDSSLPLLEDVTTFGLLIASGFFFTLGSLVFVRATEEPPLPPLFSSPHLETDELLAAWLFLLATIPFVPFMAVYVYYNSNMMVYWGCLVASILFVTATYMFVLACYPTDEVRQQIIPFCVSVICGEKSCLMKHLSNDWLAAMWIFFFGTLLMCIGSVAMLYFTYPTGNHLEIFDWGSSTIDSIIFLIGSAYFCAGSYPVEDLHGYETDEKQKDGQGNTHLYFVDAEVDPLLSQISSIPILRKDRGV